MISEIKTVFSDFDGTLTLHESLGPVFFDIIELLKLNNIPLVIVTGRSLSWGHFLLTHFPYLTDVIVEGGGAILSRQGKVITETLLVSDGEVDRLSQFVEQFIKSYPQISLSVDSFGRKTDRAIELHDLKDGTLFHHVEHILTQEKINFSTSNVHLNFWCGEISKYKAVNFFINKHRLDMNSSIFFGDSLNDQAMFQHFGHTVGVANINLVLDRLVYRPKVILEGDENIGPFGVLRFLEKILIK